MWQWCGRCFGSCEDEECAYDVNGGDKSTGGNRGSSDGEGTSSESHGAIGDPCGSENGTQVQFRRRERLHRRMQSELCEITPELKTVIGERRLAVLRRQFSWHDSDNNGYIESHELQDFLRAVGFNPVQSSLEDWCSLLDSDNEGCLTFPDYVEFWQENKRELENDECMIQMAFAFFDKDGDGTVDKQEFLECLQLLGDPLTQEEIDRFFEHVLNAGCGGDDRGDKITYEELIDFFREDRRNTWLLGSDFDEPQRRPSTGAVDDPTKRRVKPKPQHMPMSHVPHVRSSKFEKQQYEKRMRSSLHKSRTSMTPDPYLKSPAKTVSTPDGSQSPTTLSPASSQQDDSPSAEDAAHRGLSV